jgi:sialic acid synthase SpsE
VTDLPLIQKVASTKKPMIISTGMASVSELEDAVSAARSSGCEDLILLKCTSTYPASPENTNISTIPHLRELFHCQVGLSDHTMGVGVAVASVALGAVLIEKHFTLNRADGGVDSAFSLEPAEMASLVVESERAFQSLGRVSYGPTEREKASLQFRRSLYVAQDIKAGEVFTAVSNEGLVSVSISGSRKVVKVEIASQLIALGDKESLESQVASATEHALEEMEKTIKLEIERTMQGRLPNIPGLNLAELLGNI